MKLCVKYSFNDILKKTVFTFNAALLGISIIPWLTNATGIVIINFAIRVGSAITWAHTHSVDTRFFCSTISARYTFYGWY